MNILVIGSGAREHAFVWKLKQSPLCTAIYVAPGNAGTSLDAINVAIATDDFDTLAQYCIEKKIDLIIVGPEVPLVNGIVDYFKARPSLKSIRILGPDKKGALLEGSKDYAKLFMHRYGIPTASYQTFTKETFYEGIKYIESHSLPIVLKADGLAAGKGVVIALTHEHAKETFVAMIQKNFFGQASEKVLIEQFLEGVELSVFVATDGESYQLLPSAKDYKRLHDGDKGPNTGGMGAVSPVYFADASFLKKVCTQIVEPTLKGLREEEIRYKGFIFLGLINVKGEPYVIEYNCRMGDPETAAIIPRIESDLVEMAIAITDQTLDKYNLQITQNCSATVVLAAKGYPDNYQKGDKIKGLNTSKTNLVFHGGTSFNEQGEVITNGGRVMAITALASTLDQAIDNVYEDIHDIYWDGSFYRKDIGKDLLSLLKNNT